MYDVALGMYDFELVLMIAEKSQKVRIRVPFLSARYFSCADVERTLARLLIVTDMCQFTFVFSGS